MTGWVAPTFSQIKAQVAAIRKNRPEAVRAVGIRSKGRWTGEEIQRDGADVYRIVQCDSPIQIRMILQESPADVTTIVLVTGLDDSQLGEDIRVRLAKRRLHSIDAWQIVKSLFQAQHTDPRITRYAWFAEMLMELAPPEGYFPVPSGVLDAETAWDVLLTRRLGMRNGQPDLIALLKWSMDKACVARWRAASEEFRAAAVEWMGQTTGSAGQAVLNCVLSNEEPLAFPIGLALGVIRGDQTDGRLHKAAGRLEQLTGNAEIDPGAADRWHAAAVEIARHSFVDVKDRHAWLEKSDTVLQSVGASDFAYLSDVSPLGFDQRLAQLGTALAEAASQSSVAVTPEVLRLRDRVFSHDLARRDTSRCLDRVSMAFRLLHWLAGRTAQTRQPWPSFGDAASAYAKDGGFVDWARATISGTEPIKELSKAYSLLQAAATELREAENREFAELLRDWTQAGSRGKSLLRIEKVVEEIVAPVAREVPVLLLVVDGMSCAVFQELVENITSLSWAELGKDDGSDLPPVIATIPSCTSLSRTSLFCGTVREGAASDEAQGFTDHPALATSTQGGARPVLFHKVSVTVGEDGSLADEIRDKVAAKTHRVVGIVVNAVDDHLLKGDQMDPKWTVDYIRGLSALLYEARAAGRVVVFLSDHGHLLERGTAMKSNGEGERWRAACGQPKEGELVISGSRVLAAGTHELIAPWTEKLRYGTKRNGYHGGVTPQEMVVPMALLWGGPGESPAGWKERGRYVPDWWEESPLAMLAGEGVAPIAPDVSGRPDKGLLFPIEPQPVEQPAKVAAPEWLGKLTSAAAYEAQKAIAGRAVPDNTTVELLLAALASRGGKMTCVALAREVEVPVFRLRGLIAAVQRVLNVEGYAILTRDENSQTVELNAELLKKQFELG